MMIFILLLAFASALSIIHDAPFSTLQDSVVVLTQVPPPSPAGFMVWGVGCGLQVVGCRVWGLQGYLAQRKQPAPSRTPTEP